MKVVVGGWCRHALPDELFLLMPFSIFFLLVYLWDPSCAREHPMPLISNHDKSQQPLSLSFE